MKKTIYFSLLLIGFTAMISQITLTREFLIIFNGNELCIRFILASWFIWGFVGTWGLGKLSVYFKNKINIFCICQILLNIFLPLSIFAIRYTKTLFHQVPGELAASFPVTISGFFILAPSCILLGFMFNLACQIYKPTSSQDAKKIGVVYSLEAIGAIIGGLLVTFVLIKFLNAIQIMIILSLLNTLGAISLQFYKNTKTKIIIGIASSFFVLISFIWLFNGWSNLNKYLLAKTWTGYDILTSQNSIYGNISVLEKNKQYSLFFNGLHVYTTEDIVNAEQTAHFALLEHPNPKEILLIGGSGGALLQEILKHPINKIDYVELDPLIIQLTKNYIPRNSSKFFEHPQVEVKNLDGRFFIKKTDQKYDSIIINIGDPVTIQLNRYYTVEFFQSLQKILKPNGIISFGLKSSENYINPELRNLLKSIYFSAKKVFQDVKVIPGHTAYFLACDNKSILTYDYKILLKRAKFRNLELKYVKDYYLFAQLSKQRINYMENTLNKGKKPIINYDFRPISYYYNAILEAAYFKNALFKKILKNTTEKKVLIIAFLIFAIILLSGIFGKLKNKNFQSRAVLLAVMTTGFAEISFQIIVLLSFQIIYGYMFYKLGLIFTSFMIGLCLGTWTFINKYSCSKNISTFIYTQISICLYPLILPILFLWMTNSNNTWLGQNLLFPFIPIIAGFIGGFQFPLANKILLTEKRTISNSVGISYGLDLFGSCLGAFFTGTFLIPIIGIFKTCILIALLNFFVLILLLFSHSMRTFKK
ncbi:hypothetical protein ACFL5N_00015 [bacterium]